VEGQNETRVRMNVSQNAKGVAQVEVTAEAPTLEQTRDLFKGALAAAREEVKAAGLRLADEAA
jgi:hypothetical protein